MTIIRRPSPFGDMCASAPPWTASSTTPSSARRRRRRRGAPAAGHLHHARTPWSWRRRSRACAGGRGHPVHRDTLTLSVRQSTEAERRRASALARGAPGPLQPDGDPARRPGQDEAAATFEHGMLRLAFPKAEQVKPRQIPVTSPPRAALGRDGRPAAPRSRPPEDATDQA